MRDYAGCAARGLTQVQTARELGVTQGAVATAAKKHGLVFVNAYARRREEFEECAARGMTQSEAARFLGVSRQSACMAAMRHGIAFRRDKVGRPSPLGELSPKEREDYRVLQRAGYRSAEALRALGREDLIP